MGLTEAENSQPLSKAPPGNPAQKDAGLPVSQRSFWAAGEAKGSRESRTEGKCISKKAQEFAAQEIFLEKFNGALCGISNIPSLRGRKDCVPRVCGPERPPELAWGGPRSAVEGARAGRVPGEGGYQARAELRAWTLGATLLCHSLTPLVQSCMVHSPGPRLPPSVKPLAAHCPCQLQE